MLLKWSVRPRVRAFLFNVHVTIDSGVPLAMCSQWLQYFAVYSSWCVFHDSRYRPRNFCLFVGDSYVEWDCGSLFRSSTNPNHKPNLALTLLTLTLTLTLTFGIADLRNSVPVPWSDLPSELKDSDVSLTFVEYRYSSSLVRRRGFSSLQVTTRI